MVVLSPRDLLLQSIATEEARLAAFEHEQQQARLHLEQLRSALQQWEAARPAPVRLPIVATVASTTMTSAQKVALFRQLFRGRDDVIPKLWINAKKGSKGYSPWCSNDFAPGICEKPRVKCGECP